MKNQDEEQKKNLENREDDSAEEDEEESEVSGSEDTPEEKEIIDFGDDFEIGAVVADNITSQASPKNLNRKSSAKQGATYSSGFSALQLREEPANYDHIKDPNVKMLCTIKVDEQGKDEVLNILLKNKALEKTERIEKKVGKKQFKIKSNYAVDKLKEDPNYKTANFHIHSENDNPEFTNDFGTARKKVISKMGKDGENAELIKLLLGDKDKTTNELETLETVNRDYIDHKVKNYLSNKQKKFESIQNKINEDFMQKHTFNPELVNEPKGIAERRNFDQFLIDQNNHNKKVQDKIKIAQDENKKKEDELMKESHPKVDVNSAKIFEEKLKSESPTHVRLYNKRFQNSKKESLKKDSPQKVNKKKKINKIDDYLEKKKEEKKPISKKEAEAHVHNLYKSGLDKKNRLESLKNKMLEEEEKGKKLSRPESDSNKVVLENVMERYRGIINQLLGGLTENINSLSNLNEGSSNFDINNAQLNRLSLNQINEVLFKFGFLQYNHTNKTELLLNTEGSSLNEDKTPYSSERKMMSDLYEALKDAEGYINIDHLFIFILAVINLYEYYLYSSFKKAQINSGSSVNTEKSPKKEKSPKSEKEDKEKKRKFDRDQVIVNIGNDINNKIATKTKYGAFDEHNNFMIPLDKAKVINKEFSIFYINFMNRKAHLTKRVQKKNNSNSFSAQATYKPQINENSNRIYNEYRNKILDLNNPEEINSKKDKEKGIMEYIDKLIVKKKKKENMYAKMKEEINEKEMEGCTFKPKINEDYHLTKEGIEVDDRTDRWDKLYKTGIQIISSKKDKSKDIIEVELYGKECTFRPKIYTEQPIKEDSKIHNDIYNEKSYELLYNRLKKGRLERYIKESVHERGEFPPQLDEFMNKNKKDSYSPKSSTSIKQKSFKKTTEEINGSPLSTNNRANLSSAGIEQSQDEIVENFNNDPEKKDAIPLLIIDVNIRPGVKKKIYVFDGDTSEGLAEKFSKEHNLDNDTKAKLQVLIQSHMSRLLMRIDEENQSISEKSSTYNLS